ncbi:MAG TPA: 16S rRNA (cytosine(967)-C(5))-methyltransferase RsmB [Candidatus Kapabacteria bacterium]|nr:16S rRNA (cytosine(967)-C(5))-methyltransferase RsmB [Candidatus Kapabacteria bacterium]HPU24250.1 16S rRNA (cytosine(967)-C(5))-methyltransferase RsmB [Candidatus Kapabacteria bacterium]
MVNFELSEEKKSKLNWVRYLAVRILSRYERSDSYLDKLLANELKNNELTQQDKALLTELINGVVRWKLKLDWALTGFYNGDYQKCLNFVKNAMRVGLYQIMFLEKIPAYAAIDESVEIVKQIQGERTAGMVNAVLRNLHRSLDKIRYPDREEDLVYYLATVHSHPKWMVKRWLERFSEEDTEKLLIANNQRPYIPIRVNLLNSSIEKIKYLLDKNNVDYVQYEHLPQTFLLKNPKFDITSTEIFQNGEITIQDPSASLAVMLANPAPGYKVLDIAAAPGGKSFFLAELMKNQGSILAIEKYSSKIKSINEGSQRLKLPIIQTLVEDARKLRLQEKVDLIFADLPCSGLGTLRKKTDIKWKRDTDDIPKIVELQKEIISNAVRFMEKGSVLIYSTCTIEPEENQEVVYWLLDNYKDLQIDPAENYLPQEFCKDGFMQTFPHIHGIDGAFAARIIKV